MTNVSQVGTPSALATSTGLSSGTASKTGSWSGTQPRTAGDLLVAIFYAGSSASAAASTQSTGSGWTKTIEQVQGAGILAIWTKIASGSDTAPGFSSTISGTTGKGGCGVYLMELTATDGTTPILTSGKIGGTGSSLVVPSGGTVSAAGCYAIAAAMNVIFTAGTTSFTRTTGWTNQANNGSTSTNEHVSIDFEANPSTGSSISDTIGGLGTVTDAAGAMIVAQPTTSVSISVTGAAPNTVTSASPVGAVTLVSNVSVAGAAPSTVTSKSPVGAVTVVSNVSVAGAVTGTVTSASAAGSVTGTAAVTGAVTGTVTSASPAGAVTGTATITGAAPSTVTSASAAGSVTGTAAVAGAAPSTVTSASPVGVVTTSANVSVAGAVTGTVTSASAAGTVSGTAAVAGAVTGTVTSASPAGTVTGTANVTGTAPNTVTSASPAGTVSGTAAVAGASPSTVLSASPVGRVGFGKIFSFLGSVGNTDLYDGTAELDAAFGGAATVVADLDGIAVRPDLDGLAMVVTPVYGGTALGGTPYGGTAVSDNTYEATVEGFTMQVQDITVGEFNDEIVNISITSGGVAFDLTDYTLTAYLKTAPGVDDDDPSTIALSSTGGSPAITVISAAAGTAQVKIDRTNLGATSAITFWRVDVVDGDGDQNTAIYGQVTIQPL